MIKLCVLKNYKVIDLKLKNGIVPHFYFNFSDKEYSRRVVIVTHWEENYNSIEVLKLKPWFNKNDTKVLAYGNINQLPLVSLIANEALLQNNTKSLGSIYNNAFSAYNNIPYGGLFKDDVEVIQTKRHCCNIKTWTHHLFRAWQGIDDKELIEVYKDVTIYLRDTTLDLYDRLVKENHIEKNVIMREVKNCHTDPNLSLKTAMRRSNDLLEVMNTLSERLKLPMSMELDWRRKPQELLRRQCADHYMGVQCLASVLSNWMWVCYYGSSNLFAFLPYKVLNLADFFHCGFLQKINRELSVARFGALGEIFPVMGRFYDPKDDVDKKFPGDFFYEFDNYIDKVHEFSEQNLSYEIQEKDSKDDISWLKDIVTL